MTHSHIGREGQAVCRFLRIWWDPFNISYGEVQMPPWLRQYPCVCTPKPSGTTGAAGDPTLQRYGCGRTKRSVRHEDVPLRVKGNYHPLEMFRTTCTVLFMAVWVWHAPFSAAAIDAIFFISVASEHHIALSECHISFWTLYDSTDTCREGCSAVGGARIGLNTFETKYVIPPTSVGGAVFNICWIFQQQARHPDVCPDTQLPPCKRYRGLLCCDWRPVVPAT